MGIELQSSWDGYCLPSPAAAAAICFLRCFSPAAPPPYPAFVSPQTQIGDFDKEQMRFISKGQVGCSRTKREGALTQAPHHHSGHVLILLHGGWGAGCMDGAGHCTHHSLAAAAVFAALPLAAPAKYTRATHLPHACPPIGPSLQVFHFPMTNRCETVYCNVEGVQVSTAQGHCLAGSHSPGALWPLQSINQSSFNFGPAAVD